jgi:hypothetical protein
MLSIKVGVTTIFCTCVKFEGHLIEHHWLGFLFVCVSGTCLLLLSVMHWSLGLVFLEPKNHSKLLYHNRCRHY